MPNKPPSPKPPKPIDDRPSLELRVQEIEYSVNELADIFEKAFKALVAIPCTCDAPPGTCRLNVGPRPKPTPKPKPKKQKKKKG